MFLCIQMFVPVKDGQRVTMRCEHNTTDNSFVNICMRGMNGSSDIRLNELQSDSQFGVSSVQTVRELDFNGTDRIDTYCSLHTYDGLYRSNSTTNFNETSYVRLGSKENTPASE